MVRSDEIEDNNLENQENLENLETVENDNFLEPQQKQQLLVPQEKAENVLVQKSKLILNQNVEDGIKNKKILAHLNQWDPGNTNVKKLICI